MDKIVMDNKYHTINRILDLARKGKSYAEIGKDVGLSRQRISQICLQHGLIRRPYDVKRENWSRYWETKTNHSDECLFQVAGHCTCGHS